jgi:hypothetical protein
MPTIWCLRAGCSHSGQADFDNPKRYIPCEVIEELCGSLELGDVMCHDSHCGVQDPVIAVMKGAADWCCRRRGVDVAPSGVRIRLLISVENEDLGIGERGALVVTRRWLHTGRHRLHR